MINMLSNKTGFILIMVMVFMILAVVGTYALYMLVSSNYSVMGTNLAANTEGYYAAMAGLRYGAIILRDSNVTTAITNNGNIYTWNLANSQNPDKTAVDHYPVDFYNDLGIKNPHDLIITITYNSATKNYTVQASYT